MVEARSELGFYINALIAQLYNPTLDRKFYPESRNDKAFAPVLSVILSTKTTAKTALKPHHYVGSFWVCRNQNLRHEPLVAIMPRWRRLFAVWPIDYLQPELLPGQRTGEAVLPADEGRRVVGFPCFKADDLGWHR